MMYMKASRTNVIEKVNTQQAKVHPDLLRNGIKALSSSPESFLCIRSHFARSLAVFSVSSYVIGIGDR
jgi:DNA-dependent protein kinase catalytic subunit